MVKEMPQRVARQIIREYDDFLRRREEDMRALKARLLKVERQLNALASTPPL